MAQVPRRKSAEDVEFERTLERAFRTLGMSPHDAAIAAAGKPGRSVFRAKLRCGKCRGRVLAEFEPAATVDDELIAHDVRNSTWTIYHNRETGEIRRAAKPVGSELAAITDAPGDARWTFSCHRSCGAKYTFTQKRLNTALRQAIDKGRYEIITGRHI